MEILRVSMIFDALFLHTVSVVVLLILENLLNFVYQSANNYKLNTL